MNTQSLYLASFCSSVDGAAEQEKERGKKQRLKAYDTGEEERFSCLGVTLRKNLSGFT